MAAHPTKSMLLSMSADPSSGSDVLFPERRITLNNDKGTITVGRASKVSTKGFVAGIDNAWFDSPVMSRLHARFCARMDDKKVDIVDLGSLHGTFLNGNERIPANGTRELKDGDTVRFGAPIWHGAKQFVPTTVKVGFQFPHNDGTSTFKVPDGSDDDASDNEFDSTDDEITQTSAQKPLQSNTSAQDPAANGRVIDLTAAFTSRQVHEVIDLSSPCGSPISLDDDDNGKHSVNATENKNNGVAGEVNGNYTWPRLGQPVISDGMGDRTDGERDDYFSDDANKTSFFTDDYPDEESDSELEVYDEATSDEDMEDETNDLDDDSDMDSEMGSLSDDDRDMGFQDPLPGHGDYGYWDHLPQSAQDPEYPEIAPLIASLSRPAETSTVANPSEIASKGKTSCSIELLLNGDKPQPAAPAPSQNTPAAESGSQGSGPAKGTHTTPSCSSSATSAAEALGTMTGKVDFFVAREQNKVALSAQKAAGTRPMSSVYALCNTADSGDQPHSHVFGPAGLQSAVSPEEDQFHPRLPELPSLFSPPAGMLPTCAGPGPCTSSNDFLPAMGSPVSIDQEMEFPRRMGISEIVDFCPDTCREKPLKRKADDISDATQEQEQWAAKAAKALSPAPSGTEEEEQLQPSGEHNEPLEVTGPSEKDGEQASLTPPQTPERPAKRTRMMHVAERLGYAALGGVTAGAMIVGTLIYTAPTFG